MSTPAQSSAPSLLWLSLRAVARLRLHLPTVPEALASLLRTVVVALFLLTFVLQPYLIPSESMEHTLLVGDFLLVNKQVPRFWSSELSAFPVTGCASPMAASL